MQLCKITCMVTKQMLVPSQRRLIENAESQTVLRSLCGECCLNRPIESQKGQLLKPRGARVGLLAFFLHPAERRLLDGEQVTANDPV